MCGGQTHCVLVWSCTRERVLCRRRHTPVALQLNLAAAHADCVLFGGAAARALNTLLIQLHAANTAVKARPTRAYALLRRTRYYCCWLIDAAPVAYLPPAAAAALFCSSWVCGLHLHRSSTGTEASACAAFVQSSGHERDVSVWSVVSQAHAYHALSACSPNPHACHIQPMWASGSSNTSLLGTFLRACELTLRLGVCWR